MKKIDASIIKQLRRYTEESYAEHHIKLPCFQNGRENTLDLINKIMRFVNLLPDFMGPTDKALLMYQIITCSVTYDHDKSNENRYSYLEALTNKKAVCMGIAELYSALCTACGIINKIVVGYSTDSDKDDAYHAWVQIYLPDEKNDYSWYMADPTWDLIQYRDHWKYYMKSDSYFMSNGHYWLTSDYEPCEKDIASVKQYPMHKLEKVIKIFRQIVCDE